MRLKFLTATFWRVSVDHLSASFNVTADKRRCENNINTNPQGNGCEEVECNHLLTHVRATANTTVKFQVPN
jgi:hypothetical protein